MSDYIKRSDVINLLWYFQDECCSAVIGDFEKLPSADRPQGEWIEVDDSLISCKCSICGWESHKYEDDVYGMPYCPNCGAKMKGINDETAIS